jgi:polar amino acid transport system substrate-binding protein
LHEHGYHTTEADSSENSLAALLAGHAKYWATPRHAAQPLLDKMEATDRVRYAFSFGHVDLYLACNPAVDDVLIERMQQALKRMEQDGTTQRIDARYLPHDKLR